MTSLIDANIIIRYLLGDHKELSPQATRIFEQVEQAEKQAIILDAVVMEVFFVLHKFYKIPKAKVLEDLKTILSFNGVINEDKFQIIEALNIVLYKNLDFVDALLCVKSKHYGLELLSFDQKLLKRCFDSKSELELPDRKEPDREPPFVND